MTRAARYAYLVLAWAFLVGVLAQVFFIGLALFDGSDNAEIHRTLGWILHLVPIVILLAAWLSRAGSRHWQWALAMAAVVFVVPIFATLRDIPVVAALHPVGALVIFALAIVVARNSLEAVREADAPGDAAPGSAAA
jgi:cytochrome b